MGNALPVHFAERLASNPDLVTANAYAFAVWSQIQHDPIEAGQSVTVNGVPIKPYMYLGAREEYQETFEDPSHSGYSRKDRLITPSGVPVQGETPEELDYHAREFGDLAWYAVNFHKLFGGRLARVLIPAAQNVRISRLDSLVRYRAERPRCDGLWADSGRHFMTAAEKYLTVAEDMLSHDNIDIHPATAANLRLELGRATGQILLASSLVLQSKLNTTLAATLSINVTKVKGRISRGTVFAPGGDKR